MKLILISDLEIIETIRVLLIEPDDESLKLALKLLEKIKTEREKVDEPFRF